MEDVAYPDLRDVAPTVGEAVARGKPKTYTVVRVARVGGVALLHEAAVADGNKTVPDEDSPAPAAVEAYELAADSRYTLSTVDDDAHAAATKAPLACP